MKLQCTSHFHDLLLPSRLQLPKLLQPFQTGLPAGSQVFKHKSPWETYHIKTTTNHMICRALGMRGSGNHIEHSAPCSQIHRKWSVFGPTDLTGRRPMEGQEGSQQRKSFYEFLYLSGTIFIIFFNPLRCRNDYFYRINSRIHRMDPGL